MILKNKKIKTFKNNLIIIFPYKIHKIISMIKKSKKRMEIRKYEIKFIFKMRILKNKIILLIPRNKIIFREVENHQMEIY
jgi:hypothetical protein